MKDKPQPEKKQLSNDRKLIIWNLWKDLCNVEHCNPDNKDKDLKYPDYLSKEEYQQLYKYLRNDVLYKFSVAFRCRANMQISQVGECLWKIKSRYNPKIFREENIISLFDSSFSEWENPKKYWKNKIWNEANAKVTETGISLLITLESDIKFIIYDICEKYVCENLYAYIEKEESKDSNGKKVRKEHLKILDVQTSVPGDGSELDDIIDPYAEEPELSEDDEEQLRKQAEQDAKEFTIEEKRCLVAISEKQAISDKIVEKKSSRRYEIAAKAREHLRFIIIKNKRNRDQKDILKYMEFFLEYIR